jgi:hypothetical protein
MCYFLYIASPLTLSEVRSMLPPGLTADLASSSDQQTMRSIHPTAATVARILAGRCSCDVVRPRLTDHREDERHLRERYRALSVSRPVVIAALERHRQAAHSRPARMEWPAELSKFVVEHARNAGPTLYWLHFSCDAGPRPPHGDIRRIGARDVTAVPAEWLLEGLPTLVGR